MSHGTGSSPRMRGTLSFVGRVRIVRGIIPAYAGNTPFLLDNRSVYGDHPRVCGEHNSARFFDISNLGSSPRMRGTPIASVLALSHLGIIPAYAGNTPRPASRRWWYRDHPRVCGEHPYRVLRVGRDRGSSPRMRGTLLAWTQWPSPSGIIPAYAGNTCLFLTGDI